MPRELRNSRILWAKLSATFCPLDVAVEQSDGDGGQVGRLENISTPSSLYEEDRLR